MYTALFLVLAVDLAVIAFGRAEDAPPAPRSTSSAPAASRDASPADPSQAASCSDVQDPGPSGTPVTCRTRTSTLTIAGERRPVILGGTQVRLLHSTLRGRILTAEVRVRNETAVEQSVLAGGQQIYLNVQGARVNPKPLGDVRVQSMEGQTVTLRFALTTAGLQRLLRLGGKAELGIRPWTEDDADTSRIGVIRFAAPAAPGP